LKQRLGRVGQRYLEMTVTSRYGKHLNFLRLTQG